MPQNGSSKIIFTSSRDGNAQIYSMNVDGSGLIRLTSDSYNDDHPRWSPNGTKILFQSDRDSLPPDPENPEPAKQDIYVMNSDGTGQTRLTTDTADDCNAVWSPDGSKIVFQSRRNGLNYQIFVMNADGTNQVNAGNSGAADYQPSWSPNGSKIAFASERDHAGAPSLYVMNVNGSSQTRLTFSSELVRDEQPAWSRDSTKIAFVSTRDGNKEIYSTNADGSNQSRLTATLENDDSPYWSPDGTKIVFRSERERDAYDPGQQIWTMNADGTSQALIASNEFGDSSPSWSTATGNQSPIASSGGPYSGVIAQNVPFTGAGSFDPDGSISSYSWTFGDGGTASGVSPTHTFAAGGTYTISLTVTDNLGAQTTANTTATVTTAASEQYLANFNFSALARQSYDDESAYWNDILRAAYPNGQSSMLLAVRELGKTLFESSFYAGRNRDNHGYVYDLYKTYLMREPDAPGWAFWENECTVSGREQVRRAFDECGEFAGIVATLTPSGGPSSSVSSLASARVDPFNQPGNGLASRDTEWSVSLLSLPGRAGLDLGLSLSYSSMIWTHSGPYIYFDEDNGWPSPGFHLGFPIVQQKSFDAQAGRNVYLLISGGSRVSLRQLGTSNIYEAADSSYLQLIDNGGSLLLRTTDGTQLNYQPFNNEWRCTKIKDRNGNFLSVEYDWRGLIQNISDTVGRDIKFLYDANSNPTCITQGWNGQPAPTTCGSAHTWASFGWGNVTVAPSFSGMVVSGLPTATIPVITQVGLDDGSRYNFEYNGSGQVNAIRRYSPDNVQRAATVYDYQLPAADCPRLTATRVTADNWTGINGVPSEAVTTYSVEGDAHTLTAPDGTVYKERYAAAPAAPPWQRGLLLESEVWFGGVQQKLSTIAWTQDNPAVNYKTNPRVTETNVSDGSNHRRTTIDYSVAAYAQYGLPYFVTEYAAGGTTEIRRTYRDYNLNQAYLDQRIIGLVSAVHLTDAGGYQAKVTYGYDDPSRLNSQATTATMHDQNYTSAFTVRGNVTSVSRWDVTDINNASKALTSPMSYNAAGAVVSTTDPAGHTNQVSYADSFSDGNNSRNTFAYPTTLTDADGHASYVQYSFDLGAKTRVEGPPPGNPGQYSSGISQTFTYDEARRVKRATVTNTGAYSHYEYGSNYTQVYRSVNTVSANPLSSDSYSVQVFDGLGRVFAAATNHPGSTGGYSAVNTIYDLMGRVVKESNPTETDGSLAPAGDDAAGWVYTQQTYDWKGRPLVTTNTDGTTKEASYLGCGCAGGEVMTLTDEVGRRTKAYSDILGRQWKTERLNWDQSVYSTTTNAFNARDQVLRVKQYAGLAPSDASSTNADASCPTGTCQQTTASFDGFGRLQSKHAPEQDAGTATTWTYNPDDTVYSVTDARGASATYTYNNNRHLVNTITYAAPAGVATTPAVSFEYDAVGNRKSTANGLSSVDYTYDQLSRLQSETRSFNGVGSFPLSYSYNLANELTSVTDPWSATVSYGFDTAGRLNNVNGSGYPVSQFLSNVQYRASNMVKAANYGDARTLSTAYNTRLQLSRFEVSGLMAMEYEYTTPNQNDNDGRVKYMRDLMFSNSNLDRRYRYDQVGRLTEALTGEDARVGSPSTAPEEIRFYQTYDYDALGHMTSRSGRTWSETADGFAYSYMNGRNSIWTYDADGRPLGQDTLEHTYDAAGQIIQARDVAWRERFPNGVTVTMTSDGDGQQVKHQENSAAPVYYLRSAAMNGAVVAELSSSGARLRSYVLAGGAVLAKSENNIVEWQHANPVTGSQRWTRVNGGFASSHTSTELDPLGVDAGVIDWTAFQQQRQMGSELVAPRYGDALNFASGCTDGSAPAACSGDFQSIIRGGGASMFAGVGRHPWYRWANNLLHDEVFDLGLGTFYGGSLIGLHEAQYTEGLLDTLNYSYNRKERRAPWENPTLAFGPQKPYDPNRPQRQLSREEISSLIDDIFRLFKTHSGCEGFVNDLLKTMNSYSGWNAGSISNILENYRQTGNVFEYVSLNISGSAGSGVFDFSTIGTREQRASVALGEIIHTAGMAQKSHMNWGGYPNVYSDIEMSAAASDLGVVMSKEQYENTYKTTKGWLAAGHAAIDITCLGAKNGMSPDNVKR